MSTTEDRFVFETEWYDQQASLIRKYLLTYYPRDNTIDMVSKQHSASVNSSLVRREEPPHVFETDGLPRNQLERPLRRFNRYCPCTSTKAG